MHIVSNPLREEEENVQALKLQQWLWRCLVSGWDPQGTDQRWTLEDNNESRAAYGWMILEVPHSNGAMDLFGSRLGVDTRAVMEHIVRGAQVDPLLAKALAVLTAQKFKHPGRKFLFDGAKSL